MISCVNRKQKFNRIQRRAGKLYDDKIKNPARKRSVPPGYPAPNSPTASVKKPKKPTLYGIQNTTTNLLKGFYGCLRQKKLERIYQRSFIEAMNSQKDINVKEKLDPIRKFSSNLEHMILSIVHQLWAASAAHARAMISHEHIKVNGKKITYSYIAKKGDIISIMPEAYNNIHTKRALEEKKKTLGDRKVPTYIKLSDDDRSAEIISAPIDSVIVRLRDKDVKKVVEFIG